MNPRIGSFLTFDPVSRARAAEDIARSHKI